ncbi:MAG: hypothetical protein R3E58_03000 [Phycisphaerae bacterium]
MDDNNGAVRDVIVLDPASAKKRLERWDRETFLSRWVPTGNVMLLVFDASNQAVVDAWSRSLSPTDVGLGS